ncbi:MAG: diguanylate cyclase (GGDEF)-like protein [Alteromonadaceae bacterium]|jgi:diguanylate cyclase (GGDEF)-like protein
MIEGFDLRTLALTNLLLGVVLGIGLLTFVRVHPLFLSFKKIGYGYLLLAFCFLLIGLRHYVDDWFSIIFANTLLVISIKILGEGLLDFFNVQHQNFSRFSNILVISILPLFIYLTLFNEDTNLRIVIISLFISLQFIYIAFHLKNNKEIINHQFILILHYTYLLSGLLFTFRALWTVSENHINSYMQAGLVHSLALIILQLMIIITSFALSWSASEQLVKDLELQATIDHLTQTYNRRALEGIAKKEIAQAQREDSNLVAIIMDIDDFKAVNDDYGHGAGDQVLVEFSQRLKDNLREYDSIARYGGEEFLLLLPNTEVNIAMVIAEKLRKVIAAPVFLINENTNITITASFGVASNKGKHIQWRQLLSQADQALYSAKRLGKDQVQLFSHNLVPITENDLNA